MAGMGFFARSLGNFAPSLALLALVLTPAIAGAQGARPGAGAAGTGAPPAVLPPPGGAPAPGAAATGGPAGPGGAAAEPAADAKSTGNVGGVSFSDKPVRRGPVARALPRRAGAPLATFPGFEQLPDGGSRLFVQLSQNVPVEERRANGEVTYVLRGAHLRVHNDSNELITVHFNTPVFRARLRPQGNDLLFVLELRSAVAPVFKVTENQDHTSTLQIDFPKGDFLGDGTRDGSDSLPREAAPPRALGRTKKGGKAAPPPAAPAPNGGGTAPNP